MSIKTRLMSSVCVVVLLGAYSSVEEIPPVARSNAVGCPPV
jgi:hypothetical protein